MICYPCFSPNIPIHTGNAMSANHILDNQNASVADYLKRNLKFADAFHLVSAYFSIYGYELLADELDKLEETRFLFGDPSSIEDVDPGRKDPKSFKAGENGLVPNQQLVQKHLAERCAKWISKDSVSVRSIKQSNFLHGKMYLTKSEDHARAGVVGSSNFTKRGLGGSDQANLEINLATEDTDMLAELSDWFDRLWNDKTKTQDVKGEVLDALNRLGKDHPPELIYYKTLYELFRKDIEARQSGDDAATSTAFRDSQIWNALYEFQKDGARSVIAKLREHNGCILADSVGLGKTYTALAVIKYFESNNQNVLVLCPKKLFANWSLYQITNGHAQNPFRQDRFGYTLLAHTDLSRESGMSGSVDLETFNWGAYDLIVIDESHNFRNDEGKRYKRLMEEVISEGARSKVLMLSATPVNTALTDLRNQIHLMTEGREDFFRQILNVSNVRETMRAAQREFEAWERSANRDKAKLLEKLGGDFLRLLDAVSISRSRKQVEKFYAEEMERVGQFPKHEKPDNRYPDTDLTGQLSYRELSDLIGEFKLSVYQPSEYLTPEAATARGIASAQARLNFSQLVREHHLVGMIRTNFLKRLESSPHSLTLTLKRTIGKIEDLLERMDIYDSGAQVNILPDDDEDDEEFFVSRGNQPYRLNELDIPRWRKDLRQDKATLSAALSKVSAITPERDGKLREIQNTLRHRVKNPSSYTDGLPNRKTLIFTTFKDTAEYLYDNLKGVSDELGLNMAMVSGDVTHACTGDRDFNSILSNFAPIARGRQSAGDEIDLLIATDCISEGQNLQDCDTVINYDIHWNPVRVIQRFGRVDRIGSRSPSVRMVNYWPTKDMDAYLNLENRVLARMALADATASGDDDPFNEGAVARQLSFRDEQLKRLREEVLDLDDLSDAPAMGDLTLDYFLTQLLRYLENNRDELENTPLGSYALAPDDIPEAGPGVIFFLRQRNTTDEAGRRFASPVHPFYFVYILDNGNIRFGCTNARGLLSAFEAATSGRNSPITNLCDSFDRETKHGQDMSAYNKLLEDAVSHISQSHANTQTVGLGLSGGRDFVLPIASENPQTTADFDLITWLIIKDA